MAIIRGDPLEKLVLGFNCLVLLGWVVFVVAYAMGWMN